MSSEGKNVEKNVDSEDYEISDVSVRVPQRLYGGHLSDIFELRMCGFWSVGAKESEPPR